MHVVLTAVLMDMQIPTPLWDWACERRGGSWIKSPGRTQVRDAVIRAVVEYDGGWIKLSQGELAEILDVDRSTITASLSRSAREQEGIQ